MKIYLLVFIVSVLSSCMSMSIYSDFDRSLNFSKYKSFTWKNHKIVKIRKSPNFDNDIIENNIGTYVNAELLKRGLRIDSDEPDLILEYEITSEKKQRQELVAQQNTIRTRPTVSRNSRGGSMRPIPYTPSVTYRSVTINFVETTLNINLVDNNSKKLIWKGIAVGQIEDLESFSKELPKGIEKMFKKLPIKKIRS